MYSKTESRDVSCRPFPYIYGFGGLLVGAKDLQHGVDKADESRRRDYLLDFHKEQVEHL